ncbi:hypothetical protein KC19_VG086100 [Ceratodon purpureus]|uniref:Secreted protein n=1 Tax=Ceratodon purpureus TaxID=3225 RepID=A0A8T0HNJ5_CERPU|nr:hypothetical protein KC19_VG086100 [Ceratodon purpureus]
MRCLMAGTTCLAMWGVSCWWDRCCCLVRSLSHETVVAAFGEVSATATNGARLLSPLPEIAIAGVSAAVRSATEQVAAEEVAPKEKAATTGISQEMGSFGRAWR